MISIPFSGSKLYSYKNVKEIAEKNNYTAVYEPFGGSCVLSVNLLNDGLVKKAVVNDCDRFFDLYPEYLDLKDKVVEEGYKRGLRRRSNDSKGNYIVEPDGRKKYVRYITLDQEERKILQDIISEFVPKKFWRYFSLGRNFTYSAVSSHKEIKLTDFAQFANYLKTDRQREYLRILKQCKINNLDWLDFFNKYKSEIDKNSLLILDPPYIETYQEQYKEQFTEEKTQLLINKTVELGCDFIFFNNNANKVKQWLDGLNYKIELTGNKNRTANRNRKDVMAYVRN